MTAAAVEVESVWLLENDDIPAHEESNILASILQSQMAAFIVGFVSCATISVVIWLAWRRGLVWRANGPRYDRLDNARLEVVDGRSDDGGGYQDETVVERYESDKSLRSSEEGAEPPDKQDV
jgi:hypothetical protein